MKNIDNQKLYKALKEANIKGDFKAFTSFEGVLEDVQKFSSLPWDAIISYRWCIDTNVFVFVDAWYNDHIDILLRINDYYLPYEYRGENIILQSGFICPPKCLENVNEIIAALKSAFESARNE